MIIFQIIIPALLGFYLIYKSTIAIEKIDRIKKKGTRKRAKVIKIRESKSDNSSDFETDGYDLNHDKINYFFTIKFNDKNGCSIEKELEFSTSKIQIETLLLILI